MLFQCFRENQDVVEVYHYHSFHYKFMENVVHHGLEGGGAVGQSKKHHKRFVQSSVCSESSFPLISLLNPDIVETPPHIQFSEIFCSAELSDQLGNEWERIFIFDGDCVQGSVVLDQLETSVFLFDKEAIRDLEE